jgi:prepilin-type N-terminal cleavage/methylation domain-containing protein
MKEDGFTLIELIVVLAIIVILLALATQQFHQYTEKTVIEQQVRTIYTDLMDARAQAIMQRDTRTVVVTARNLTIFDGSGNTIKQEIFPYQIMYPVGNEQFVFNTLGMASGAGIPMTICVQPVGNTPAGVDGMQIDTTMIQMAKVTGGSCDSAHISIR